MSPTRLALTLVFAAAGAAQVVPRIAFPQESRSNRCTGTVPFGTAHEAVEARAQILVPAERLPQVPCAITGVAAICTTYTGPVLYRTLDITLSPTTDSRLSMTFAANLHQPQVVLRGRSHTVNWVANQWVFIPFAVPYQHDGRSSVVVEVRKDAEVPAWVGTSCFSTENRTDLPLQVATYGPLGSGASAAAVATGSDSHSLILLSTDVPTITLRSDPPGNVAYPRGFPMYVQAYAAPGTLYVPWVDIGRFQPPVTVPGISGALIVIPSLVLPVRTVTTPPAITRVVIPAVSVLQNQFMSWQAVFVEPTVPFLLFSNGCDGLIF